MDGVAALGHIVTRRDGACIALNQHKQNDTLWPSTPSSLPAGMVRVLGDRKGGRVLIRYRRAVWAALLASFLGVIPLGSVSAAPTTYEIEIGKYIFFPWAQSVRMYPSELNVHRGDTLHFTSEVLNTVTLLPKDRPAEEWLAANHEGGGKTWSLYMADDGGAVKLNNTVAAPSKVCGWPTQSPCDFDATGGDAGVLNSGLPFFDDGAGAPTLRQIDFTVRVTAAPGTSFDVVSLTTPRTRMTVTVVDDAAASSIPTAVAQEAEGQFADDSEAARALDAELKSSRRVVARNGIKVWKVYAGVDTPAFSLRRFYPSRTVVRSGDSVRWTFGRTIDEAYTVTFPRAKGLAIAASFPRVECDAGSGGDPFGEPGLSEDGPPQLDSAPYCTDPAAVEFQVPEPMVNMFGDRRMDRRGEEHSSGLRGPALGLAAAYEIKFRKGAVGNRFAYIDMVHALAGAPARGVVVVKSRPAPTMLRGQA